MKLCALLLLVCAACAGVPKPHDRLVSTRGLLVAADAIEADQVPRAALHLEFAREQLARAEALMKDGHNEDASYALQRAEADAKLAVALSAAQPALEQCAAKKAELARIRAALD